MPCTATTGAIEGRHDLGAKQLKGPHDFVMVFPRIHERNRVINAAHPLQLMDLVNHMIRRPGERSTLQEGLPLEASGVSPNVLFMYAWGFLL